MVANRIIEQKIRDMLTKFPVLTLTGTRQCGKTTLLKKSLPEYKYISLEDKDIRDFAQNDERGFLASVGTKVIIDEAQRVPDLFSYIQTLVDSNNVEGQYILTGSHNFLLMENISQSLAGRCAVLKLAPFSIQELKAADFLPDSIWTLLLQGSYPRIYDKSLKPEDYFPSYVSTYIERDVRSLKHITDTSTFIRFVKLCAARTAQVLNITELANSAGISVPTAMGWLSILEQSYIVFRLSPYHNNFSKRLVKSPKLYFYDTGLLCYLLGIESESQLEESNFKGHIFETLVISEYLKSRFFVGKVPECFYWRDTNQNEVDLLVEQAGELYAYEIKLAQTMNKNFTATLQKFANWADLQPSQITCIYTGQNATTNYGTFCNYQDVWEN